jgi:PKD repeat protein
MPKKYILLIGDAWTEYNKIWPAIKALRDYLTANPTLEPQRIVINLVDTDKGYISQAVPYTTLLRGVTWKDAEVPVEWTGALDANFVAIPPIGIVNLPITFASMSVAKGYTIVKYEWSIDGGATWAVGDKAYKHTFTTPGKYQIVLRITDDGGDKDKSIVLEYVVG